MIIPPILIDVANFDIAHQIPSTAMKNRPEKCGVKNTEVEKIREH